MKKNFMKGLLMLAAGVFAVSCADYNVTDDFTAEPDQYQTGHCSSKRVLRIFSAVTVYGSEQPAW